MILHISPDEKFMNIVLERFERLFPGKNSLIVKVTNPKLQLKYINENGDIKKIYYKDLIKKEIIEYISTFKLIILHNIDIYSAILVLKSKNKKTFYLSAIGGDIYALLQYPESKILLPKSKKLSEDLISFKQKAKIIVHNLKNIVLYGNTPKKLIIKAINQIRYCGTVIKEDYELILKEIAPKIKYIPFFYGSIEKTVASHINHISHGNNIIIGNSSSVTSNHIEIFDILCKTDIDDRKIFVPLSYGNSKYRRVIIEYGKQKFGNNFFPVLDFMSQDEFNEFLLSAGFLFLNHRRQQAMGVIYRALWFGIKVFISNKSPVYIHLKNNDFIFYTIEDIKKMPPNSIYKRLNPSAIAHNRKALLKLKGEDIVNKQTILLVNKYLN